MESKSTIKHFEIEKLIGSGGMADIYKAFDKKLNRYVAIKVIKSEQAGEESIRRFISEARTLAQLNHPNITQIYEIFKKDRHYYIVMEYLDGLDLKTYIKAKEVPLKDLVTMFQSLAEAFVEVHEKGILHRDIKPSNLFITNRGVLKIIDFGIAKWDADPNNVKTQKNFFIGSLQYTAPEVFADGKQSTASDIYALGLSLLYCIQGDHYFNGNSVPQILSQITHDDVVLPEALQANLPEELKEFIQFSTEKDPKDRYQEMTEVKENLETISQRIPNAVSTMTLRKLVSTTPQKKKLKNISDTWVSLKDENKKESLGRNFFKRYLTYGLVCTAVIVSTGIFYKKNINRVEPSDRSPAAIKDTKKRLFTKSFEKLNEQPDEKLSQQLETLEDNYIKFKKMGLEAAYIDKITIRRINSLIEKNEYSKAKNVAARANFFLARKIKNQRDKDE